MGPRWDRVRSQRARLARHDGCVSVSKVRTLLRLMALAAVLVGTLSGCFTFRMDLQLRTDDTVDGSIVLAFDEQAVEQAGGQKALIDALIDGAASFVDEPSAGGAVEVREYRDDRRVGVEYVLSAVPIGDFNTEAGARSDALREFSIQRVGDTFVVDGKVNVGALVGTANSGSTTAGTTDGTTAGTTEALDDADLSISLTFPGTVLESNGTVKGHTVTWTPSVDSAFVISAVGEAGDESASGLLIGVLVGLCLLAVLFALAVIASRRRSGNAVGRE